MNRSPCHRATRNTLTLMGLIGLGALSTSCSSDSAMSLAEGSDSGSTGTNGTIGLQSLRLDVYPSDATPGLLPQSIAMPDDDTWTELSVQVRPTVSVSGLVLGFEATPYFPDSSGSDPTVPGEDDVPVDARIDVFKANSVAGATATTDADGAFTLSVPAGEGYELVIVPEDSARLPFEVRTLLLLASDLELSDLYLDYGAPVWGQITRSDGTPVDSVQVHLEDVDTGAAGPIALVDDEGWYLLRAYPGDYDLVVEGVSGTSAATVDPTVRKGLAVDDDDGVRVDVDLGSPIRSDVDGVLVDEDGQVLGALDDYLVRFTSVDLGDIDGDFVFETDPDREGRFSAELMPGQYLLEIIPEFDAGMSPVASPVVVGATDTNIGEIVVPGRVPWSVQILDPWGEPAAETLVVAKETGFDGYTYSATTGQDGLLTMELPATQVELTLTPADSRSAITHIDYDPYSGLSELRLCGGRLLSGNLVVSDGPVTFALVEVRDSDGLLYAKALTDGDGAFGVRVEDGDEDCQ